MMTRAASLSLAPEVFPATSDSLLRWTFRRGLRLITCEVRRDRRGGRYGVHIIHDGDRRRSIVESAPTPLVAMRRHAEIAMQLRDAGWSTARRSS